MINRRTSSIVHKLLLTGALLGASVAALGASDAEMEAEAARDGAISIAFANTSPGPSVAVRPLLLLVRREPRVDRGPLAQEIRRPHWEASQGNVFVIPL